MSGAVRARLIVAAVAAGAAALVVTGAVLQSRGEGGDNASKVDELRALVADDPRNADVRIRLGIALVEAGDRKGATAAWREAEKLAPDSPAFLRAEGLLHPEFAPGRPPFVSPLRVPPKIASVGGEQALAAVARRARAGGVDDWLLYGSILQRAGRPVSARRAFERAVALAPGSLAARTALDVALFSKDDPSGAFSRLGPLAARHQRAQVVRFHLGLMLLWIRQLREARRQLTLARSVDPASFYGRQAGRVLSRLRGI